MQDKSLYGCGQGLEAAESPSPSLHFSDHTFPPLLGMQVGKEQKSQRSEAMWASLKELLKPTSDGYPASEGQQEGQE